MDENNYGLPDDHIFTYEKLREILENAIGKTLGEVDGNHVFDRAITNPKITGIAGDVVEQSVLGYQPDSDQRPDILVDGVPTEVKTTGIRYSKKKGHEKEYEAKEPMSITAVSPQRIVNEEFQSSNFWHKLAHMLLVYYLYDSEETVQAKDYADFYLKSYQFYEFDEDDKARLQNDWETVRDFIKDIQRNYPNPETQYPRISSELREKLMYVDTAPKWPHPPRFRLKRSLVTAIVQSHFHKKLEKLPVEYDSFTDFDKKLHTITAMYKGKSVEELIEIFGIHIKDINKLNKAISEQIIVRMFGGKSNKINQIDLFRKVGIIAKSICISSKGTRTEDTKLFGIDFDEAENEDLSYEDTSIFDYFMNHQVLCIIFEEKDKNQRFKDNKFVGFKRITFDFEFINNEVRKTWEEIKDIIVNKKLVENLRLRKDGSLLINKTGISSTFLNFPKSKNHIVFVRGGGKDSTVKPYFINGLHIYKQYIWIKGSYMVQRLGEIDYI